MSSTNVNASDLAWRKARRSALNGECVEVAPKERCIVIRDSQDPDGATLLYSADTWRAFIANCKSEKQFLR